MRLYRVRGEDERRAVVGMVSKKDVRKWLEDREAERSGT
jgi:signal recognition particle receptor subunit alpha